VGIEARALVPHTDSEPPGRFAVEAELDVDAFAGITLVAVRDGVDHALPNRHTHPVQAVVVEPRKPTDVITHRLHEVEHVEAAVKLETDGVPAGHRTARL